MTEEQLLMGKEIILFRKKSVEKVKGFIHFIIHALYN